MLYSACSFTLSSSWFEKHQQDSCRIHEKFLSSIGRCAQLLSQPVVHFLSVFLENTSQILGWAVEFPTRFSRRCSARIGLAMARWKRSWRTCTVRGTLDISKHRRVNPRHQKSWQTHNTARRNSPLLCHTFGVKIAGVKEATKAAGTMLALLPESFFFQVGRSKSLFGLWIQWYHAARLLCLRFWLASQELYISKCRRWTPHWKANNASKSQRRLSIL